MFHHEKAQKQLRSSDSAKTYICASFRESRFLGKPLTTKSRRNVESKLKISHPLEIKKYDAKMNFKKSSNLSSRIPDFTSIFFKQKQRFPDQKSNQKHRKVAILKSLKISSRAQFCKKNCRMGFSASPHTKS